MRRYIEKFPQGSLSESGALQFYKQNFCDAYRGAGGSPTNWQWYSRDFMIPFDALSNQTIFPFGKTTNNSSIVTLIRYAGRTVLFGGDLETIGWKWLLENDAGFVSEISGGLDVLIAPHHGHKSAFPEGLWTVSGHPLITVLSKGREFKDGTDVDGRYSADSAGLLVKSLGQKTTSQRKSLTSRNDGNIFIEILANGALNVFTSN